VGVGCGIVMRYVTNSLNYQQGQPRVFVPFEDRNRDLSQLLEFGTVLQVFPGHLSWQLKPETSLDFTMAVKRFFAAHDFTDDDFVVAIGDPVVIAVFTHAAAMVNSGRVKVLKWDRLPCVRCNKYRQTCGDELCPKELRGRYLVLPVQL
jgi:hypothetical protein